MKIHFKIRDINYKYIHKQIILILTEYKTNSFMIIKIDSHYKNKINETKQTNKSESVKIDNKL